MIAAGLTPDRDLCKWLALTTVAGCPEKQVGSFLTGISCGCGPKMFQVKPDNELPAEKGLGTFSPAHRCCCIPHRPAFLCPGFCRCLFALELIGSAVQGTAGLVPRKGRLNWEHPGKFRPACKNCCFPERNFLVMFWIVGFDLKS